MPGDEGALWLFAGSNGAGKSTLIEWTTGPGGQLAGIPLLNPDVLTKQLLRELGYNEYVDVPEQVYRRCFIEAARKMEDEARHKIRCGETICIETVLSTDKYVQLCEYALSRNMPFYLVYVVLSSPELACERVALRVSKGGHPVPQEKITKRYHRSVANLAKFAEMATHFRVFDNSDTKEGEIPELIVEGAKGRILLMAPEIIPAVRSSLSELRLGPEPSREFSYSGGDDGTAA